MLNTKEKIEQWLNEMYISQYTIHNDLTVDVNSYVDLGYKKLVEIPIQFGRVSGDFSCSANQLISLKGCPKTVDGDFICTSNKLTSLKYSPQEVHGAFMCDDNELISLEGISNYIGKNLHCQLNKIESFDYKLLNIGNKIICSHTEEQEIDDLKEYYNNFLNVQKLLVIDFSILKSYLMNKTLNEKLINELSDNNVNIKKVKV